MPGFCLINVNLIQKLARQSYWQYIADIVTPKTLHNTGVIYNTMNLH